MPDTLCLVPNKPPGDRVSGGTLDLDARSMSPSAEGTCAAAVHTHHSTPGYRRPTRTNHLRPGHLSPVTALRASCSCLLLLPPAPRRSRRHTAQIVPAPGSGAYPAPDVLCSLLAHTQNTTPHIRKSRTPPTNPLAETGEPHRDAPTPHGVDDDVPIFDVCQVWALRWASGGRGGARRRRRAGVAAVTHTFHGRRG